MHVDVRLHEIAHGRSGDKGDRCNISIIAFAPEAYPPLVEQLTAERVRGFFAHRLLRSVTRYELPRLSALNFVIDGLLEGGVNYGLGLDAHGKTLAFWLLTLTISVDEGVLVRSRAARNALVP